MKANPLFIRTILQAGLLFLLTAVPVAGQAFSTVTSLGSVGVSDITGEKPQSKVWKHYGQWWMVMPNSSGTHVWRLDGTSWANVLTISSNTGSNADCKVLEDRVFILLFQGASSQLITVLYSGGTYTLESTTAITLDTGVETATIDIDSQGRMWLASDESDEIFVRYSDFPYSSWSTPIQVASGINTDDICAVAAFNGRIGVLWSNQNSRRFGFRYHVDGADPTAWSADEVPASQSALNVGAGMADDHLNMAVASDGTIFAAVKTSYDGAGYPRIAMLIRRPAGTWDDLYEVSQVGTRAIVILNEIAGKVKVVYTASDSGGDILYRESPTSGISFGPVNTLMTGGTYNNPTSIKQTYTGDVVVMASTTSTLVSVLATDAASNLVAHWKMDESTGATSIDDATINSNDGALTGSPVFAAGKAGNAIFLNNNQYASVADNNSLDITSAITMAAWINCTQTAATTQRIIAKAIMGSTNGYELSLSSAQKVFARFNQVSNGDSYRLNSLANYSINGSGWMHIAATYDGSYIRIYINGVQDNISLNPQNFSIATNTIPLEIGRQNSATPYYFRGYMDDVRIYSRVLSAQEILALATNLPPTQVSPVQGGTGQPLNPVLTWGGAAGATSYGLQVSTSSDFSSLVYDQSGITSPSATLTGLIGSTVYYWKVNATYPRHK